MDFEDSSKEWRKNKIYIGKGYFKYKCKIKDCINELYSYTTEHKCFKKFALPFDLLYKNHKNKYIYCEEHLLIDDH
jgi:hypothetical protein